MTTIQFNAIPDELRSLNQWVVWKAENNTKIPYQPSGAHASSTDPSTWTTYELACKAAPRFSGIGFVFSGQDGFVGIDLDDCIENDTVAEWAREIIETMQSYSEVSPSGTGIKIWVKGELADSVKTKTVEIYPHSRYFTMTGWHVDGTPTTIRNVNGELNALADSLKPAPVPLPQRFTTKPASRKWLERWAQHKIEMAIERVAQAGEGEKHNTRYKYARLLGGLIPHGLATEDGIASALYYANMPKTQAQRTEYKTILDGIRQGYASPLDLPPEPEQPVFDSAQMACCPKHTRPLAPAKNGNGYKCRARDSSTDSGWCAFWWDGEGYHPPVAIDPDTGEITTATNDDILINANRSDVGNAECLIALRGDDFRFCHTRGKWLEWDGSRWRVDEIGNTHRTMVDVVRMRFHAATAIPDATQRQKFVAWCIGAENTGKIKSSLEAASLRPTLATVIDQWDSQSLIAAAKGATLDLRAVVHRAVQRDDYLTMQLGAAYEPESECPRWLRFLDEVFAGDAELIAFVQRAVGYTLTGDTREQKLFLMHGGGANGKSAMINTLMRLFGDYAGNASFETFDANKRSESSNDLAMLRGKRLITVVETEEGRKLAEARVKSVTGQDLITCRFLYREYFSYRMEGKIWMAMNHLPVIRGTDNGIWRRILLIPFNVSFADRPEKTLETTLAGELDGILQWALEGLRQWWLRGLDPPERVTKAVDDFRSDSDQVGRWIAERCVQVPNIFLASSRGYDDYRKWTGEAGEEPVSQNKWSRRMNDKGFKPNPNKVNRGWFGVGLLAAQDEGA